MTGISCAFSYLERPDVAQLKKGQTVKFRGKVTGKGLFDVEIKGCSVIDPDLKVTRGTAALARSTITLQELIPTPVSNTVAKPFPTTIPFRDPLLPTTYPIELTNVHLLRLEQEGFSLTEITT